MPLRPARVVLPCVYFPRWTAFPGGHGKVPLLGARGRRRWNSPPLPYRTVPAPGRPAAPFAVAGRRRSLGSPTGSRSHHPHRQGRPPRPRDRDRSPLPRGGGLRGDERGCHCCGGTRSRRASMILMRCLAGACDLLRGAIMCRRPGGQRPGIPRGARGQLLRAALGLGVRAALFTPCDCGG